MLESFDSTKPGIADSVAHAKKNLAEIGNQSPLIREPGGYTMQSPVWPLTALSGVIEDSIVTIDRGSMYDYLPEGLSRELYGTVDLWYILLRLNGAMTRGQFRGPTFRVYKSETASGILLDVVKRGASRSRTTQLNPVEDLTIRRVVAF